MYKKLDELKKSGKLTPYLYGRLVQKFGKLPKNIQEDMLREALIMSSIGVNSEDDHKHFAYITMHLRKIAEDLSGKRLGGEELAKLSNIVYDERESYSIDTVLNFYRAVGNALNKLEIPIKKHAYPQGYVGEYVQDPYNVKKWMKTMREIYSQVHNGYSFSDSFKNATSDWDVVEMQNFKNWMKFYQEGNHNKYVKTAQDKQYYCDYNGAPMIPLQPPLPSKREPDMGSFKGNKDLEVDTPSLQVANVPSEKDKVKDLLSKLTKRLSAAENLIANRAMQEGIGMDVKKWLEILHGLKREIQTAPITMASSPILGDLIIRKGNALIRSGYVAEGNILKKIAQPGPGEDEPDTEGGETTADLEPGDTEEVPTVDPGIGLEMPSAPDDQGTVPESQTGQEEDQQQQVSSMPPEMVAPPDASEEKGAMKEFVDNLNGNIDSDDSSDAVASKDLQSFITVTAQPVPDPVAQPLPDLEPEPEPEPQTEVITEDMEMDDPADITVTEDDPETDIVDLDTKEELNLSDVSVKDVIIKLELVSNILKNREIPRQLAMIDLMMDKLNIASFFPTLAEATRSALESNQYMSTRIEDILSKLRGSLEPSEDSRIDLSSPEKIELPETPISGETVKGNLEEATEREENIKDIKKKQRETALEEAAAPEEPEPEVLEELVEPVEIERAAPARVTTPTV